MAGRRAPHPERPRDADAAALLNVSSKSIAWSSPHQLTGGMNEGCEAAVLRLNHSLFLHATNNKAHEEPARTRAGRVFALRSLLLGPPTDVTTILDPDWP
ncbi:hypothetical protein NDU88_001319 [Pleurodeles waltl]|uniref:Uncharacterized protein n=1 Tax=Pleurodeles waltl TaxID=8319 RepID=A0AAV7V9B4_PLEWA|nr:hypothetical protein NDU88_001319 [Pleurodeles waltl]